MGNVYSEKEFERILNVAEEKRITILIDEAYYYFYPHTFINYALTKEHIFVTRTFSKLCSMAGCRLGYVAGWSEGIKIVQKLCTPHNTNAFALKFAEKIITDPKMLDELINKFNEGRKYLIDTLALHGYEHQGEAGNFLFIKPRKVSAQDIVAKMKSEYGILIKAYPNVGKFGNCLRVTIGEKQFMEKFVAALLQIEK